MYENDSNDEFNLFLNKIVRIDSENHKLPIYGRLKEISPQFLAIERKDGHLTLIKKKAVLFIEAVRNQGFEAV